MKVASAQCLIINAPEWFKDPVFVAYLNRLANSQCSRRIATWHKGGKPGDFSDIFVVYDNHEGSDFFEEDGLEYVWGTICAEADKVGMTYGVVWIKNIGELP